MNRFVLRGSHDSKLFFGRANSYLNRLRCGMGLMLQNKTGVSMDDVRVVRFEDVKQKHRGLMEAFCRWLGIEYDSILEETTVNGCLLYTSRAVSKENSYQFKTAETFCIDAKKHTAIGRCATTF